MELPTKQEMFNRAYKGLEGQGWRQAMRHGTCVYKQTEDDGSVLRCAWGHVDPVATEYCSNGTVEDLSGYSATGGIAAAIAKAASEAYAEGDIEMARNMRDLLVFARQLQRAHDNQGHPLSPEALKTRFDDIRLIFGLDVPTSPRY